MNSSEVTIENTVKMVDVAIKAAYNKGVSDCIATLEIVKSLAVKDEASKITESMDIIINLLSKVKQ
ncbi:MAG: hypothetical protein ACRYGG_12195 [Janthinobacterium lividum]